MTTATPEPTRLSLGRKVRLFFLLIFKPDRFQEEQSADNRLNFPDQEHELDDRHMKVRRALISSGCAVGVTVGAAVLFAFLTRAAGVCASDAATSALQIGAALTLLWAPLYLIGWDVKTYGGISFTERMDQWIFWGLCCIGTFLLVLSLAWKTCIA